MECPSPLQLYKYCCAVNSELGHQYDHKTTKRNGADMKAYCTRTIPAGHQYDHKTTKRNEADMRHIARAQCPLDNRRLLQACPENMRGDSCSKLDAGIGKMSGTQAQGMALSPLNKVRAEAKAVDMRDCSKEARSTPGTIGVPIQQKTNLLSNPFVWPLNARTPWASII